MALAQMDLFIMTLIFEEQLIFLSPQGEDMVWQC